MIRGNKDMIRELIDNLVQNAIRYNKEGGHVEVFAGMVDGKGQQDSAGGNSLQSLQTNFPDSAYPM